MRRRGLAPLCLVGLLALPAGAADLPHTVAPGEDLQSIARQYFGPQDDLATIADVLGVYNGIDGGELPNTVRVPRGDTHRVRAGDTWSSLAHAHLGAASLAGQLARWNDHSADRPLALGTVVRLPVRIRYRVGKGESLARIARRFYGGPGGWQVLQAVNGLARPDSLRVGDRIEVPVMLPPVISAPDPSESPVRVPAAPEPPAPAPDAPELQKAQAPAEEPVLEVPDPAVPAVGMPDPELAHREALQAVVRQAIDGYLEGDFEAAVEQLEGVRPAVLASGTDAQRALLLSHLVFVYVAFDREADACTSYRALEHVNPAVRWNPDLVSPKILRAVADCP